MDASKPVTSPMSASVKLSLNDGPLFDKPTLYQNTIGSLQYLSLTCPDIAYSINKVCQFMHNLTVPHWQAVKRILRYLKNTIYTFVLVLIIRYMPLLMRIGLDAQMIAALLVPSVFFLGLILYPEVSRNRALSLVPAQRLNTRPWQTLLLNFSSFSLYFVSCIFFFPNLLPYGVRIWEPLISLLTQSCTPTQNTVMWTSILSMIGLRLKLCKLPSSPPKIKFPTSLLNLLSQVGFSFTVRVSPWLP